MARHERSLTVIHELLPDKEQQTTTTKLTMQEEEVKSFHPKLTNEGASSELLGTLSSCQRAAAWRSGKKVKRGVGETKRRGESLSERSSALRFFDVAPLGRYLFTPSSLHSNSCNRNACYSASANSTSFVYGSSNQKRVPRPFVLSTWICSPWACKICFTMLSPSPVPPLSRARSGLMR